LILIPDHIHTTFTTVCAHLEACNARCVKQANPTTTAAIAVDSNNTIMTVEQQNNGEPGVRREEGGMENVMDIGYMSHILLIHSFLQEPLI
jgi:hypothetical protein